MAARRKGSDLTLIAPEPARQESPRQESNSVIAERSLRALILSAERIATTITDSPELMLARPDVVAKALSALGETINTAADGLARFAAQHDDAPEREDPLRGSLEAYEKELDS
jgi:hypothetical protein